MVELSLLEILFMESRIMTDRRKEFGDWQTPADFALKCCKVVKTLFDFTPAKIIEPTCGEGNFINAALQEFPLASILGIEINGDYVLHLESKYAKNPRVDIQQGDYLSNDALTSSDVSDQTLFLGNPPWVTNSFLSSSNSDNLPVKKNFKGLKGVDAITGASNFDICEWMILKSIELLRGTEGVLAMLCKTNVARRVCVELSKKDMGAECKLVNFDSREVFGISASACLFVCDLRASCLRITQMEMSDLTSQTEFVCEGGSIHKKLPDNVRSIHGMSVLNWRQGVKHDCSKVMELRREEGGYINNLGEKIKLEDRFIFPYLKSSMLKSFEINTSDVFVPITQSKIGEDTSHLKEDAPNLWCYLSEHANAFKRRKSSIYKGAPLFSMFGVGEYSFAPFKVAVSGFYKKPQFSIIKSDKPIMLDDTCYFLPFWNEKDAWVCMLLLNSELVQSLYLNTAFLDNKRPFTKKVLSQLNFEKALAQSSPAELNITAERINASFRIDCNDFEHFRHQLHKENNQTKITTIAMF